MAEANAVKDPAVSAATGGGSDVLSDITEEETIGVEDVKDNADVDQMTRELCLDSS